MVIVDVVADVVLYSAVKVCTGAAMVTALGLVLEAVVVGGVM